VTEIESAFVGAEGPMRSPPAATANLERRATGLASPDLCAAGVIGDALQDEGIVKIIWHNAEGHLVSLATGWPKAKGEAARMLIGNVFSVPDLPVRFILDQCDQIAHASHEISPNGGEFLLSIGEEAVFLRKLFVAAKSRLHLSEL